MGRQLAREAIAARSGSGVARRPAPVIECASASTAGLDAAAVRTVLDTADAGTRQRLAASLQRQCGNVALQRLLAPDPATARAQYEWMRGHETPDSSEVPGVKHRVVDAIGKLCGWDKKR